MHRRTQLGRHEQRHVHRVESASRRWHGELAASESAAVRTGAATQPSVEAALARAAVSGEQSEGRVEGSTSIGDRSTGGDAACIAKRVRAAAGKAIRRRARAPPHWRAQRAAERRGGAGLNRGQRRAEHGSG